MTSLNVRQCIVLMVALLPGVGNCDSVLEWNEIASREFEAVNQLPFVQTRSFALLHAAIYDAATSIEKRYSPYKVSVDAPEDSSTEAAVSAAAFGVLSNLLPSRLGELEVEYSTMLARIPSGPAHSNGVRIGEEVARRTLEARQNDGADATERYKPISKPGIYISTTLPVGAEWGGVRPWLLRHGSQLRGCNGPPPLDSQQWAEAYTEVKQLGARNSRQRTKEQTDIARFWAITGPPSWNPIVRQLALEPSRTLIQNARLFALVALTTADANIAVFDAKYAYHFWRPITAIRNGDDDNNPATIIEDGWLPLLETPLHPEYPCAHCITAAAVAVILAAEFGDDRSASVNMTSPTAPGIVRSWPSFQAYSDEVSSARIFAGLHYRFSTVAAAVMGREIGALALRDYFGPVRGRVK